MKNRIHSVLHANLIPPYLGELFSAAGTDEELAIRRHVADLDARATDLSVLDEVLAQGALKDQDAARLMTISGIDMVVALRVVAAIGDIKRFSSPEKLVSYLGLNPSARQSGTAPAHHGRISKQGRSHARAMLVEAAWAAEVLLDRYESSCSVSRPVAASRSPPSLRLANSPPLRGIC